MQVLPRAAKNERTDEAIQAAQIGRLVSQGFRMHATESSRAMLRIVLAFRIGNPDGHGFAVPNTPTRYFDLESAKNAAEQANQAIGAPVGWLRPWPCTLLEAMYERGESLFLDLGSPVQVQRANTDTTTPPPRSESEPAALKT